MRTRNFAKTILLAAACALAVALAPSMSEAQSKSKAKMVPVPAGGCAISGGALENNQTCAAACNEHKWCPVQWCVQGQLQQTVFSCYEPTGVCTPKC
jgi:hypothetical protein